MPRKIRTDTMAGQINAVKGSTIEIQPPSHVHLREQDKLHWRAIIAARAYDTWNDSDLEVAGQLARCRADIEMLQADIDREGNFLGDKENPKHKLLDTLTKRGISLARLLHIHASGTIGQARDTGKRTRLMKDVVDSLPKDDDDLLAKPVLQ